uniref:Uncharacterized protein n=1 Tax=Micrococcus phage Kurnik TaxID=3092208 RepID=A0AAU6R6B3_9CAUD
MANPLLRLPIVGGPHDGAQAAIPQHGLTIGGYVTVGRTVYEYCFSGGKPVLHFTKENL